MLKGVEAAMRGRSAAYRLLASCAVATCLCQAALAQEVDPRKFADPPAQYRPIVSIFEATSQSDTPEEAARRVLLDDGAGSIMFSPEPDPARARGEGAVNGSSGRPLGLQDVYPSGASPWLPRAEPGEAGMGSFFTELQATDQAKLKRRPTLGYMTPAWFAATRKALSLARAHGRFATYYDEVGYPSGSADHQIPPHLYRKLLQRRQVTVSGFQHHSQSIADPARLRALVAVDVYSGQRVDLMPLVKAGRIDWTAPSGTWAVQEFTLTTARGTGDRVDYYGTADYFDPRAADWFLERAYEPLHRNLADYLGTTVTMSFFDDVGIFSDEKSWSASIDERFRKITGRAAAPYYPALWQDIGADTAAARVGFFKARAQLLGEGLPGRISDWTSRRGIQSSGHAPGNYDIQPVDMNGDPFSFYALTGVPMSDAIFGHGFGRGGFKLISSVSAARDLPVTASETFSAYNSEGGYRRLIELYLRGINRFVSAGKRALDPRGTARQFNEWAGRTSLLLQGGRSVADIGILFPIESLQAFYAFDAADNVIQAPAGTYVYRDCDYQAVGEMLANRLHRDFTFLHPDALAGDKLQVAGSRLKFANRVNDQSFRVLIVPGGEVLSVAALAKVRAFYEAGGAVIGTSLLPSKSAEFGRDAEVKALVAEIFGDEAERRAGSVRRNARGGRALFVGQPSPASIGAALDAMDVAPDVSFAVPPEVGGGGGVAGYVHRQKEGRDIYFFGNSSRQEVATEVRLQGHFDRLELWDPHSGAIAAIAGLRHEDGPAGPATTVPLRLAGVSSLFIVGQRR